MDENKKMKQMIDGLNNINDSLDNGSGVDEAIFEFESFAYNTSYERLKEGWIVEKETIYDVLEFFIRVNDEVKINFISYVLNHYYEGYLEERFNEYLDEEKYEICEKLKNVKDIVDMPKLR